jgi:hypothetical protein
MRHRSEQMRSERQKTGLVNGGQSACEEIRLSLRGDLCKDWINIDLAFRQCARRVVYTDVSDSLRQPSVRLSDFVTEDVTVASDARTYTPRGLSFRFTFAQQVKIEQDVSVNAWLRNIVNWPKYNPMANETFATYIAMRKTVWPEEPDCLVRSMLNLLRT